MFGSKTKTCGHLATYPFRARCSRDHGHAGQHSARGLNWGSDGRIRLGGQRRKRT
jgi:hypothetical protein